MQDTKEFTSNIEGPIPIPIPPIQHIFPAKKSLSPSQSKQKNSPNQKTNRPHNQNMGQGKFSATHPHKEPKMDIQKLEAIKQL
jgi:hypothetical protein